MRMYPGLAQYLRIQARRDRLRSGEADAAKVLDWIGIEGLVSRSPRTDLDPDIDGMRSSVIEESTARLACGIAAAIHTRPRRQS